jgi:tetratricopeptide (TPR) repeat protein
MKYVKETRALTVIMIFLLLLPGLAVSAPAKKSSPTNDALMQMVADFQKNTKDNALREKIIKTALTIKPGPVPEEVERNMARGVAFFNKASDSAGYQKAIAEFEAAANGAPWLDLAYYNLGVAQEKNGLYKDAIQNLKYYLMAAPDSKKTKEVKSQIWMLEATIEEEQGASVAAAVPAAPSVPAKTPPIIGAKAPLAIEPEKPLKIIKLPQDKKSRIPSFVGSWSFKDIRGGEETTIQAFEITVTPNGEMKALPPNRGENYTASVMAFDVSEKALKLQLKWKMRNTPAYWKTETYDLTMSDDGKMLSGSYNQESVGGKPKYLDKDLFRQ